MPAIVTLFDKVKPVVVGGVELPKPAKTDPVPDTMHVGADGVAGHVSVVTVPVVNEVETTDRVPPLLVQVNPLKQVTVTPDAVPVNVSGVVAANTLDAVTAPVADRDGTASGMLIESTWPPELPEHVSCTAMSGLLPVAGMALHTQLSAAVAVQVQ